MSDDQPDSPAPVPDYDEITDPKLAGKRTELAWIRNSIAFFALGVAIVRFRPAVGVPVLAIGSVIWLVGRLSRAGRPAWIASRRELVVTATVTMLAIVALVLTLASPASRGVRP